MAMVSSQLTDRTIWGTITNVRTFTHGSESTVLCQVACACATLATIRLALTRNTYFSVRDPLITLIVTRRGAQRATAGMGTH